MAARDLEFGPGPFDPHDLVARTEADLAAFCQYVQKGLTAIDLFGRIARQLYEKRPNEVIVDTDVAAGSGGRELAELAGALPSRFANSDAPLIQDIYYPSVRLPDGTFAMLREIVHREGIDSAPTVRIPWLHILSEEVLCGFREGEVDYLSDKAHETYDQYDVDPTGRIHGEPSYAAIQRLFFSHPRDSEASDDLERQRRELVATQGRYLDRLRAVACLVLPGAPSGTLG